MSRQSDPPPIPLGALALAEMKKACGDEPAPWGVRGELAVHDPQHQSPPPPPPPPFRIPPYDTSSFVEPVIAVTPPLVVEDEQTLPAKSQPSKAKTAGTPNLDRWRATMMRSDTP